MLDPHGLIAARYFFCLVQVISFHLELLLKNDDEKLENSCEGPPYTTRGGGGAGGTLVRVSAYTDQEGGGCRQIRRPYDRLAC